jgi:hypothetical protein
MRAGSNQLIEAHRGMRIDGGEGVRSMREYS